MKKLTQTILAASFVFALPLASYAASGSVATTQGQEAMPMGSGDCPMGQGQHMGGKHHKRMGNMKDMTPEQVQAHLQERYDAIKEPEKKAQFINRLNERAEGMSKHAEAMKQFTLSHQ